MNCVQLKKLNKGKRVVMDIVIKKMETEEEIRGKGYVDWKAVCETYSERLSQDYFDTAETLEKCTERAFKWKDNTLGAKDCEKVVGFVGYDKCRYDDIVNAGEVVALYILLEYYDRKIGYELMNAAVERLGEYDRIVVRVLEGNERAIRFYERYGFRFDEVKETVVLGTEQIVLRMVLEK